ncbi:hypothetical protein [Microbacterium sp. Se5.02b]|uniref:hypothetical protein n=1 Tax=Microbacterium sp. Se5.02b TaxID=2864103 RepID=UPI00215DA91A|nr:hypothetical protein [Microbacterium sp. Se5.02b]
MNLLVAGVEPEPEETAQAVDPKDVGTDVVPKVTELSGTRQGDRVVFTWTNPSPLEGDSFIWTEVKVSGEIDPQQTPETTATVPAATGTVCIDVMLRRDDGRASETVRGCVE